MAVLSHPKPAPDVLPRRPEFRVIESRQRGAKLHVLTYLVGNAIFWTLWAAISVAADAWYWWLVVPFAGWTIVLALHLWHAYRITAQQASMRWYLITGSAEGAARRVPVAALLLIAGLVAGPIGTHVYWMVGGSWGLGRSTTTIGIQVVAAAVVVLLVGAVLVALARVGVWRQAFVSDRVIRFLAWALAVFFLGHGLLSFIEGLVWGLDEWWLYGPSGLAIGLLALVVAGSGGAWPRLNRPYRTLPSR